MFISEFNLVSLKKIISAPRLVMHWILCSVVSLFVLRLKLLTFCDLNVILGKSVGLGGLFKVFFVKIYTAKKERKRGRFLAAH